MHRLRGEQLRHHVARHTRVRFERRAHTHWDFLSIAIIVGAAFIAANFIFGQQTIFDDLATLQNFLEQEQFESIKSAIKNGR